MLCERCGIEILGGLRDTTSRLCYDCIEDDKKIHQLHKEGHTHHCACKMVFGGAECECGGNNKNTPEEKRERAEKLINIIREE